MEEIWKDIPGYEGLYQVSSLGHIKSFKLNKERYLKQFINQDGYYCVELNSKHFKVHQIIAITFLNHKPCGNKVVVDHINNIKADNRVDNLQLISHRNNCSKDRKTTTGFTGVSIHKQTNKYRSYLKIGKEQISLGLYNNIQDAHIIYQTAIKLIDKFDGDKKKFRELVLNYQPQLDETK